jgi:hypothetical protein
MQTPNGREEIEVLFGNPALLDGTLNIVWKSENIRRIAPPPGWQLFYQSPSGLVNVPGIRMHRLLKPKFHAVLKDVWAYAKQEAGSKASDDDVRSWLHLHRLDQYSGSFNFRKITGGECLSLHAFGIAIDWDAGNNPRKQPLTKTLPDWWYELWKAHGWADGRFFSTPDPMHVQFAIGA